jgi:hypothetical protein
VRPVPLDQVNQLQPLDLLVSVDGPPPEGAAEGVAPPGDTRAPDSVNRSIIHGISQDGTTGDAVDPPEGSDSAVVGGDGHRESLFQGLQATKQALRQGIHRQQPLAASSQVRGVIVKGAGQKPWRWET